MNIAVDIALIPPPEIQELCIDLNKQIYAAWWTKIIFGQYAIPHISILMWVIDTKDIDMIHNKLSVIGTHVPSLPLTISEVRIGKTSVWDSDYSFAIKKTPELQLLHQAIFDQCWPSFSRNADKQMLAQKTPIEPITIDWINAHHIRKDFTLFSPHITLWWWGNASINTNFTTTFYPSAIWLYHLGNYCTCTQELALIHFST